MIFNVVVVRLIPVRIVVVSAEGEGEHGSVWW
jgi:hypothetical protein